jgi:hypothetical protein
MAANLPAVYRSLDRYLWAVIIARIYTIPPADLSRVRERHEANRGRYRAGTSAVELAPPRATAAAAARLTGPFSTRAGYLRRESKPDH